MMKPLPQYSLFIGLLLFSCNSIKPAAPYLPVSALYTSSLANSKINIPVSMDVQQVLNNVAANIPVTLSGQGNAGSAQYRWKLFRQTFAINIAGDSLHIKDAGNIDVGGYVKNPFGNNWAKVCSCNVVTSIDLSMGLNILPNYSLPAIKLSRFNLNACNLDVINFNISPVLKPAAEEGITNAITTLNTSLQKYNFRSLLQPVWNSLNQPIKVANLGYISINPSAVYIGHPYGSGTMLNFSVGVTARPVFSLADPGKTTFSPLPDLSKGEDGSGFNLNLDIHLDYKPLNDLLKNKLTNQRIEAGPKSYIIIQDADVFGSGNEHLLFKVKFTGKQGVLPYHGILYFTCMPDYDPNTGELYIKDIDFDTNTIAVLKQGPAVWILNSAIRKYLNSEVHFNIAGTVNNLKDDLTKSLNRPVNANINLSGKIDSLSLIGILPGKDYILVRLKTIGSLSVQVH